VVITGNDGCCRVTRAQANSLRRDELRVLRGLESWAERPCRRKDWRSRGRGGSGASGGARSRAAGETGRSERLFRFSVSFRPLATQRVGVEARTSWVPDR
jgi:hypothetical protein